MSSWYRSSKSLTGPPRLRRSWPEQLAHLREAFEQHVHILARVVEPEGGPHAGGDAEMVHHRHRAVMTRAHGDALLVEHRANLVRMDAVEGKRQDGSLVARRAEQLQSRNLARTASGLVEERVLMRSDDVDPDLVH